MSIQNILNFIGLLINMIGAYIMYHHTTKVSSQIVLYQKSEAIQKQKKDLYNNKMIRRGMWLLFFGFLFQLASFIKV